MYVIVERESPSMHAALDSGRSAPGFAGTVDGRSLRERSRYSPTPFGHFASFLHSAEQYR